MTLPRGVHRVRRKLVNGKFRYHFYVARGGDKFWVDDVPNPIDPEFSTSYAEVRQRPVRNAHLVEFQVEQFLASSAVPKADRSRRDQKKWLLRFAKHFSQAPIKMFSEPKSRRLVRIWRDQWKHSPKQFDMAGTHATRFLNWCVSEGLLDQHHLHRLPKLYQSERVEIVWSTSDVEKFMSVAPMWACRLLTAALETGLRPDDLIRINRGQIDGQRLRVRTAKRGKLAYIPISPELRRLIDETPKDRFLLLGNRDGDPISNAGASRVISRYRDKAGLDRSLQLRDARGTAATRLLMLGLTLMEITVYFGWSLRYAQNVIEHYARVSPEVTDKILVKLANAKGNET